MRWLVVLLMAASASAYSLTLPRIGYVRDSANAVRPIYGLAGNFVVGDAGDSDQQAVGFTGPGGFLKSSSSLKFINAAGETVAAFDAPSGPALVGIAADQASAIIHYPQATLWSFWHDGQLDPLSFEPGGSVLALAITTAGKFDAVIARDDGRWLLHVDIASASIESQESFPGTSGPVLLRSSGLRVYVDGTNLVVARPGMDAVPVNLSAAADSFTPETFADLGADWIYVHEAGGGRNLALRITPGREQMFVLPEVGQ